ncbi:hypothetical protein [Cystobacter ferrugineus]|uniref:hypothetical protein n=1 Tax=Cystobacter ferrugineus TaxID=83449 RepID=UPI000B07261C|nr:hypothetical protein [Cystobacter ferrugineus]
MMKTLKVGLLGMAMGVLAAVALSSQEAQAQKNPDAPSPVRCCSSCNPSYQNCVNGAGNNPSRIQACVNSRATCEAVCRRGC